MLSIEAAFPAGTPAGDLEFGNLRVSGDMSSWSTGQGTRIQLIPTLITMARELLAWCRSGVGQTTLHSFEAKKLLTLDEAGDGRVRVSGPDGPLHVAADAREVFLAFHTAAIGLVDRYPELTWTVAHEDFWAAMADFRVQCLPGYTVED